MKNIIINPGIRHYHDDEFTDDRVEILEFPYMSVFGDFRIFNGLPIELVDDFIGRLKDIMMDVKQAHAVHEDYWKTHPNTGTDSVVKIYRDEDGIKFVVHRNVRRLRPENADCL